MQRWRSLQNFSEKIKKDRDRRQKDGRFLARSLPDSHGQPGYFAVFLNSHPAQSPTPGYFRASCSHSQKTFFLRDMKPLGLFVLPLYHRGAAFAMNSARTKPQQYPTETQLNLYKPVTFPPHLSASGVWESFRAVSKALRDFFTRISLFLEIHARPCAGRPLTQRSRSPFFSPPKGAAG